MARNPLSPFRPGGLAERGLGADPFTSLHREVNRLFEDAFHGFGLPLAAGQGGGVTGGSNFVERTWTCRRPRTRSASGRSCPA